MALTDYTLTDADIGRALTPADGFLVSLARTQAGPFDGPPRWDEGSMRWVSGRFVLRGSRDFKDLLCVDTGSGAGWAGHNNKFDNVLASGSLGYAGDLIAVSIQRGSVWTLTLSDIPIDKTLKTSPLNLVEQGRKLVEKILVEQGLR
ncbi:MAG TPA: hypothetical protein VFE60_09940 [Roseiarcus sp.]|jgi:hypothetical protein|nr:hypothetical protein [Roseiarcus sp.]